MDALCPTPHKVRFTSREQALTDARRAERKGAGQIKVKGRRRAYQCECGSWHVTSMSKRDAKRRLRARARLTDAA